MLDLSKIVPVSAQPDTFTVPPFSTAVLSDRFELRFVHSFARYIADYLLLTERIPFNW